ncbi:MAG: cytochrome c oxidase subunit 3 [Cyclobacteriaceae bacterium]
MLKVNPKKFTLWLFIVSIVMIFISMTSAYIVKRADLGSTGELIIFDLPEAFFYTTILIALSSLSMHWSYLSARKDELTNIKIGLGITFILSLTFLAGQWFSWVQLVDNDVYFVGNAVGSFIYVLTGLHAFHLISGIIFLLIVLISAMKFKVHSRQMLQIEMCATYWHFLGGLWVYLYVFLSIYN